MNISSLVLQARPERIPRIVERLQSLAGVEVHAATDEGKVVITLETDDSGGAVDRFYQLGEIEGVLSVSLVYEYSE